MFKKSTKTPYLLLSLLFINTAEASDLKPFKSDGCSAFPDGTLAENKLWLNCCYQHDLAYWQGGSAKQRAQADQALKSCVTQVGKPMIADLMLAGVRVGGTPYLPTQFRWAYGWPYFRGYKELSTEEQVMVSKELDKLTEAKKTAE